MKTLSDFLLTTFVAVLASLATQGVLSVLPKPQPAAVDSGCHCGKSPTTPPGRVGELAK
jgi:hypothetical protein